MRLWMVVLGAVAVLVACGGDKGDSGTTTVDASYTGVRDDILIKSCGISTCHQPNPDPTKWASESELVIDPADPDAIYDALVGATAATGKVLIVPSDIEGSFLITKVLAEQGVDEGDPMPPPFGLDADGAAQLIAWVEAGAPNE